MLMGCLSVQSGMAAEMGLFEGHTDIGKPSQPGRADYDAATGAYVIAGGGENMWFTNDAFHFVWKQVSGDFALESTIEWMGSGGNAHRKACLMIRQDLSPGSAYVDVAVHGDGLTSLQFREKAGGMTHEVQANLRKPLRVGLERQGQTLFMTLPSDTAPAGAEPLLAGAFRRVQFTDPVYVGLGVCAHDDKAREQARFTQVQLRKTTARTGAKPVLHSTLEVVPIGSKDRRVVYHTLNHIEAPNWSPDGRFFLFNGDGRVWRLEAAGGDPVKIDTGFANRCNNDHGISPDGKTLVISDQAKTGKSVIYTVPIGGGEPRQVTPLAPSYWHGWSPDGKTLAYCAERNGEYDVYTIPVQGGEEKRLTTAKGLDDGPDYTYDGQWIYFNSERSGTMHIWRMKPDGTQQEQVTSDEFNNWFPHPSPDGKWIVFLSYNPGVKGHPANEPVRLRLMPIGGGPIQDLASLFGGQGTINVPSWSPDSKQVAFVSYELIYPRD
jgi:hypothetical protein